MNRTAPGLLENLPWHDLAINYLFIIHINKGGDVELEHKTDKTPHSYRDDDDERYE